ncbi:voltage-dependent anion channel-domain-containing protein [Xylaria venustula]|nr:voltage-dependent anion channel-domain-containing protein [Xylaria venustula]
MCHPSPDSDHHQEEGIELEDMASREGSGAVPAATVSAEERGRYWIVEPVREEGALKTLQQYDFGWFACPVGTGISAIVTHAISDVFPQMEYYLFMFTIGYLSLTTSLFLSILSSVIARYYTWPKLFQVTIKNPDSVGDAAMMPTALGTIITIGSKLAGHHHPNCITVLWALWWIAVVVSLVVLYILLRVSARASSFQDRAAHLFRPVFALTVLAATRTDISAQLDSVQATVTLVTSTLMLCVGVVIIPLAVALQCVVLYGITPLSRGHIIEGFIAFASLTQFGLAIQQLGEQLYLRLPHSPGPLPGSFDRAHGGDRLGSLADVLARELAIESWFVCFIGL